FEFEVELANCPVGRSVGRHSRRAPVARDSRRRLSLHCRKNNQHQKERRFLHENLAKDANKLRGQTRVSQSTVWAPRVPIFVKSKVSPRPAGARCELNS